MVSARRPRRAATPPAVSREEIDDLLSSVGRLRLTLTADLSAAAAALDEGEPGIAGDIVAADQLELSRLLRDHVPERPHPRRPRRILLALPAIPLAGALAITAAAAIVPHAQPHATPRDPRSTASNNARPESSRTATSTLRSLERLIIADPRPGRIVALAAHLHLQLSEIVEKSRNDPTSISEVQRLLSIEQRVLEGHRGDGVAAALAASRHLTRVLTHALSPTGVTTPTLPLPASLSATPTTTRVTSTPSPNSTNTVATSPGRTTPTSTPTHTHRRHAKRHHPHSFGQLIRAGLSNSGL